MLGVLSHHSSANPGWRYQFLFLSHILSMLATCIQFFPLQGTGTPLIFQKQEQRVEILHLKIVRTLCCSISSYARRSYPHHVWLQIWALKASRSFTTHIALGCEIFSQQNVQNPQVATHSTDHLEYLGEGAAGILVYLQFFLFGARFSAYFRPRDFGFWAQFCSHLSFDIMHTPRSSQSWSPNTSPPHVQ